MEGNYPPPAVEAAEQDTQPLTSHSASEDALEIQRQNLGALTALLTGVSDEVLIRRPTSGKWSVCCILAHLAEDELVSGWRYRQMIEKCGSLLPRFDQDEWARLGRYDAWKPREALEMFRLLREANLRMLSSLTADEWQCYGVHAERGNITVESLARHMAGHDAIHFDQVRRLLTAFDPGPGSVNPAQK